MTQITVTRLGLQGMRSFCARVGTRMIEKDITKVSDELYSFPVDDEVYHEISKNVDVTNPYEISKFILSLT